MLVAAGRLHCEDGPRQFEARPIRSRLHRARRNPQHSGDLFDLQPLDLFEEDHLAAERGELAKGAVEEVAPRTGDVIFVRVAGGGDEVDGLDDLEGGGTGASAPKAPSRPAWDAAPVKARMRAVLREAFGRKASKIEQELEKCPATKLGLLDFCTKAEKFIYVFIDTARARPVAERLRTVVEEPLP